MPTPLHSPWSWWVPWIFKDIPALLSIWAPSALPLVFNADGDTGAETSKARHGLWTVSGKRSPLFTEGSAERGGCVNVESTSHEDTRFWSHKYGVGQDMRRSQECFRRTDWITERDRRQSVVLGAKSRLTWLGLITCEAHTRFMRQSKSSFDCCHAENNPNKCAFYGNETLCIKSCYLKCKTATNVTNYSSGSWKLNTFSIILHTFKKKTFTFINRIENFLILCNRMQCWGF